MVFLCAFNCERRGEFATKESNLPSKYPAKNKINIKTLKEIVISTLKGFKVNVAKSLLTTAKIITIINSTNKW